MHLPCPVLDARHPENPALDEAARILAGGGLVVIPTDTVYGLAVLPEYPGALERLYALKGREQGKPVAFFVNTWAEVEASPAQPSSMGQRLAERFWPGPLTLVLPGPKGTLGFRAPDHTVPQALVHRAGRLAVSSANASGAPEAHTAEEAAASLGSGVDLILDAGLVRGGIASTVVKISGTSWEILREGPVTRAHIEETVHTP